MNSKLIAALGGASLAAISAAHAVPAGQRAPLQLPLSAPNGGTGSTNGDGTGIFFPVRNYGSCVWDGATGHDVGPCVNAAIAAAAAAGGGTVTIPAGAYYFATPIQLTVSGVSIKGAGWGHERDNALPYYRAATRLVYNGTTLTGTTPAVYVGPIAGSAAWRVSASNVKDIAFDGGGLASVVIKINNADYSTFRFGCYNPAATGDACIWLSAEAGFNTIGNQENDYWLSADVEGPGGSSTATGILIDGTGADFSGGATLAAPVGLSDTTISVTGAYGLPTSGPNFNYYIMIDNELMRVTGGQGTGTWTVQRGINATTVATHLSGATATYTGGNVSYDRFHFLSVHYTSGDGIIFANSDTDSVDEVRAFRDGSATTGSAFVFANDSYIPPSGFQVGGRADNIHVFGMMGSSSHVQGSTTSSLWQVVASAGTGALNPQTLTTNAASSNPYNSVLNFASVSNVYTGESMNCGGDSSGVYPQTMVVSATATTVSMQVNVVNGGGIAGVPSGTVCTFSYGLSSTAVAGTYNLAYNGSSFTLTAPSGGNTQSGVTVTSGMLKFTDMFIPFTGTPNAGDNWNIVVPHPASRISIEYVDKDNQKSDPYLEPGTFGSMYKTSNTLLPVTANGAQGSASGVVGYFVGAGPVSSANAASGGGAWIEGGDGNTASGLFSSVFGATGSQAKGQSSSVVGGNANQVSGLDSISLGGANSNDFGRYVALLHSYGAPNGNGSAQGGDYGFYATATSTSAVNPTANGGAASTTNCLNLTATQGVAFSAQMIAFDRTTNGKAFTASWGGSSAAPHVLTRGASNATTLLDGVTTAVAPDSTRAIGSITGQSAALQADTTHGCVTASFTPPTSNTDTWTVVVRFHTVEAQ